MELRLRPHVLALVRSTHQTKLNRRAGAEKAVCVMGSAGEEEGGKGGRASGGASEFRLGCGIYLQLHLSIHLLSSPSEVRLAISGQALPAGRVDGERGQPPAPYQQHRNGVTQRPSAQIALTLQTDPSCAMPETFSSSYTAALTMLTIKRTTELTTTRKRIAIL